MAAFCVDYPILGKVSSNTESFETTYTNTHRLSTGPTATKWVYSTVFYKADQQTIRSPVVGLLVSKRKLDHIIESTNTQPLVKKNDPFGNARWETSHGTAVNVFAQPNKCLSAVANSPDSAPSGEKK